MFPRLTILAALLLPAVVAVRAGAASPDAAGMELFEKKVRPILVERCLDCHSAEKKVKGGLHLDSREGWEKGGDSGPAIEPGKPEESLLLKAVSWRDKDLQMPPKKKLSDEEIAILNEWVQAGAPDPRLASAAPARKKQTGLTIEEGRKFWSYILPQKTEPPAVKDASWLRSDLDRFILAKLEEKGLMPAPDASPEVLVRRLYYNLIGLPPSPEELAALVNDLTAASDDKATASSDAATSRDTVTSSPSHHVTPSPLARLVDQLLARPQFGETWGRHWLDVARFAESSGGGRTLLFKDAWRYRDYVIEAFNRDEPFDQFIREQIAGDILPAANNEERRRQLTATAFLVLGPTNYEEQDKQQLRFDIIDEQLDTIGKAVLGQTIGCARCHDHKFDPIPQRDYYAMAGIMASTRTLLDYSDNVAHWLTIPLPLDGALETEVAANETKLTAVEAELETTKKKLSSIKLVTDPKLAARQGQPIPVADLPGVIVDDTEAKAIGEWKESRATAHYIGNGYRHDMNAEKGRKTLTFVPKLPASGRYEVRLAYPTFPDRATHIPVHIFHADGEETVYVDESMEPPIDGRFVSLGRYRFEKDGQGYVLISNDGTTGVVGADAVQFLSEDDLKNVPEDTTAKDSGAPGATTLQARRRELEAEKKELDVPALRRPMAMTVREDDTMNDTQICIRGQVHQRGAQVPRGFLQVAMNAEKPAFSDKTSGRLEFAQWLSSAQNPLTARVFVNRVWTWLFGEGLVRTTDNFGTTGDAPSHPELLDYLTLRFIDEGWSVKKLVREIVLSRTWAEAVEQNPASPDPDNRLLAHANRRRLDAEQIRDTILAVSGDLQTDVGGPNIVIKGSVNGSKADPVNALEYDYVFADTRRSIYTPAFRNKRLELFEVFDFGDINVMQGRRNTSTVAPQALYLLNHPFVIAQAKAAASRTLESSASDDDRLLGAFRRSLGRPPTEKERAACMRMLAAAGSDDGSRLEAWSEIFQSLFGCIDFRYLE